MMAPVLVQCGTTVFGQQPGDATGGGVWTGWEFLRLGSPFTAVTPDIAAPQGRAFFLPTNITSLVELLPQWAAAHVVGPICSWNLLIYSGFVLDGLAVFGMVWWLTRRPLVAFIAGYAYAFTPFHIENGYGHPGYVHSWLLVLVMWAMLALTQRPTWRRALLVGASVGLAGYADGYYLLFAPVIAVTMAFAGTAWWLWRSRRRLSTAFRFPAMTGVAVLTAVVLMLPIAYQFLHSSGTISDLLDRSRENLYVYGARPLEYVLPSHAHPVFGAIVSDFENRSLMGSNFAEANLYIGISVLLLGACSLLLVACSARARARLRSLGLPPVFLVLMLTVLVVVSGALSAGGLPRTVTTPADLIFNVVPFWRVFARFFLVVDMAVVVLAAVALCMLPRNRWGGAALIGILLVIGFDLLALPPWQVYPYQQSVPSVYQVIEQQPSNTIIAEYPISETGDSPDLAYLTYQVVHQRRIINAALPGTPRYGLEFAVADLSDPETLPVLRALGVTFVLIHDSLYAHPAVNSPVITGLHEVRSGDGVTVYRIDPGPSAQYAITLNQGFATHGLVEPASATTMTGTGQIGIWSFAGTAPTLAISFEVTNLGMGATELTVTQDGQVVWAGRQEGTSTVRFGLTNSSAPLIITANPSAVLELRHLVAAPASP
jgi:hypothetical protein